MLISVSSGALLRAGKYWMQNGTEASPISSDVKELLAPKYLLSIFR